MLKTHLLLLLLSEFKNVNIFVETFPGFLYYINISLQICFEWFIPLIIFHLPTNPKANVPTISTHTPFLNNISQATWFILSFQVLFHCLCQFTALPSYYTHIICCHASSSETLRAKDTCNMHLTACLLSYCSNVAALAMHGLAWLTNTHIHTHAK